MEFFLSDYMPIQRNTKSKSLRKLQLVITKAQFLILKNPYLYNSTYIVAFNYFIIPTFKLYIFNSDSETIKLRI